MSQDDRLLDLLQRWLAHHEQGQPISATQLCCDCPELTAELERKARFIAEMDRLVLPASDEETVTRAPGAGAAWPVIAGYEVEAVLGEGGMGTVYRARDVQLGRLVALKVVRAGAVTAASRARFLAEAQAVARLDHPHIVKVFEVGQWTAAEGEGPLPYLALEYVPGGTLDQRMRAGALEPIEAARLVRLLAKAMHHAHEAGIVHRDLKPANVLLAAAADEPALNTALGCPKVSDFGLARSMQADSRLTAEGAVVGTPSYMAPEQAEGQADVGPAADVYALGAILYRLLTGRPPFAGRSSIDTLHRVCNEAPQPPRKVRPEVPAELEAPVARPGALAEALAPFAAALPGTTVSLAGRRRVGWRPSRRRLLAAVLMGLVPVAAVGGLWWWQHGGSPAGPGEPAPLKGAIDVEMTRPGDKLRQVPIPLRDPGARPLKAGDEVRIRVDLNRQAFVYVLWVDTRGQVLPVYPWLEGEWDRPEKEEAVAKLRLPEHKGGWGYWTLDPGPAGLETMVLLARETPLPAEVDLKAALAGLGAQKLAEEEGTSVAWFENGEVVRDEPLRAPNLKAVTAGSSPLERINGEVQRRVGRHFTYTRAVTFGTLGNAKRRDKR
jgi:serine/threonine protein kinase